MDMDMDAGMRGHALTDAGRGKQACVGDAQQTHMCAVAVCLLGVSIAWQLRYQFVYGTTRGINTSPFLSSFRIVKLPGRFRK